LFGRSGFATLLGFGGDWQNASFDDSAVLVSKPDRIQEIPFTQIRARKLQSGWLFSSIQIETANSPPILLKGIRRSKARSAFEKLSRAIDEAATDYLKRNTEQILAVTHRIAEALAGRRYIAHSEAAQLRDQAASHLFILFTRPNVENCAHMIEIIRHLDNFHANYESVRAQANAKFFETEKLACADFFRSVEKQPLTEMQTRAVLTDEDATLVLAGAGSGKTSVIVGKVAYLLHRGLRSPQEILTLAFSRDARVSLKPVLKDVSVSKSM
jgi:DNA helicase IV